MANFNGILDQFNQYQDPGDINLINQTLAIAQNKYDVGEKNYENNLSQLKQQENLLKRPEDKLRFSENIRGLINEINGKEGGIDWAKRGLTNKINTYTNSALDDYTLEQIGIGQTIRAFDTEVAKKREKNDGSYADQNYRDAQEQAGLGEYMSGKTNKIGSLSYSNYVDVNGKMGKKAKEYSELMGREQLLDTTTGTYYTTDTKGKKVTMNEIYNTLRTELGQDDLNQLNINARQSLGKLPKEELNKFMSSRLSGDISELKTESAALKAEMLGKPKSERASYAEAISQKDQQIKDKQNSIDTQSYDIYSAYKDMTIKDIASNYDFAIITDVKRDYGQLNILKFQHDVMNDERNFREKVRENDLKEKEVKATTQPIEIDKPQIPGELKDAFTEITDQQKTSLDALDKMLIATDESKYKDMTAQERLAYRMNLPINPTDSKERQNAIRAVQTSNRAFSDIVNTNTATLVATSKEAFNNITGAKLENLKNTAPYTVAAKKMNKKFEDLDKNVQKAITLEMTSNILEFGSVDEDKAKIVRSSLNSLAGQLANHPSDKVKNIYKQVETSYKAMNGDYSFNKTDQRQKRIAVDNGLRVAPSADPNRLRSFSFNQDNNITELEGYSGDTKFDTLSQFNTVFNSIKTTTDSKAMIAEKNLISNKAFSFSTEIKGLKADTEALRAIVLTAKADNDNIKAPSPTNNTYIVNKKGVGYEISYMVGKSGEETMEKLYVDRLPSQTASKFEQGQSDWNSSFLNPNIILPKYNLKTESYKESLETIKSISEARPDVINPQLARQIRNRGDFTGTAFQTKDEHLQQLKGQPADKIEQVKYILDANYQLNSNIENGELVIRVDIKYPDGKEDVKEYGSSLKELDNTRVYLEGMEYIKNLKDAEIQKILN